MAEHPQPLTVKWVNGETKPGLYSDGRNGFYLKITKAGGKRWVYRFRDPASGKLRDMGLGTVDAVKLVDARQSAEDARRVVQAGRDPIRERKLEKAVKVAEQAAIAETEAQTFDWCCEEYIKTMVEPTSRNPKHVQQWRNTLSQYASPVCGSLPVGEVDDHHILEILEPIWHSKTETAQRLMQRMAKVLNWAKVRKYRTGDNPAMWAGHLEAMLPSPNKIKKVKHHASLPYSELPAFIADLRGREGNRARCLEFVILTAVRTTEARAAQWDEFDLGAKVWEIPAERMKMNKPHRVPLSPATVKIIKGQVGEHDKWVFPGERGASCLSNMAMLTCLRDMGRDDVTTHGMRSSFRTWCAEQTNFPRDIAEAALAHSNKDKVEDAYLHTDHFGKRTKLMKQWANFVTTVPEGNVIQLTSTAAS